MQPENGKVIVTRGYSVRSEKVFPPKHIQVGESGMLRSFSFQLLGGMKCWNLGWLNFRQREVLSGKASPSFKKSNWHTKCP